MIKNLNKYIYTLIIMTSFVYCRHIVYAGSVINDKMLNMSTVGEVDYEKLLKEYINFLKKDILIKNSGLIDNELENIIEHTEKMLSEEKSDKEFEEEYYSLIDKYNELQANYNGKDKYEEQKNIEYFMQVLDNISTTQNTKTDDLNYKDISQSNKDNLIDEVANLLKEESEFKSYKAQLLNVIVDANETISNKNNKIESYEALDKNIIYAKDIYNSNVSDISVLEEAIESISTLSIDYRNELKDEIEKAEDMLNNIEIGNKPGQYTQDSVNRLYAAIYAANQKYDNGSLSDDEINSAIQTLQIEINVFEDSIIKKPSVDITILMGLIQQAKKLINETSVGNEINQVPAGEKEKLQVVLDSAKIIAEMSAPSQDDVDDAVSKLNDAIIEFRNNIKLDIDKSILSDTLKKAISLQNIVTEDKIGNDVGKYPKDAKDRFDKAIESAQAIMDKSSVIQDEVDNMATFLENEISIFNDSKVMEITDKSKLKSAITKGETLLKNITIGNGEGETKKEYVDEFKIELKSAKEIASSYTVTQAEIDTAMNKLNEAITKLQESENKKYEEQIAELKNEISGCVNIYNNASVGQSVGDYPKASKTEFKSAIESAEAVLSSGAKKSAVYTKALSELEKAREKFESSLILSSDLDDNMAKLNTLLKEITTLIKTTNVGSVNDGVSQNQKIALSVMLSNINKMVEDTDDISVINNAIKTAKNTLSDFKDESIYIDNNNKVNGRKLTGKVSTISNETPKAEIVEVKEEFIPQAGMPIDIKVTLSTLSAGFMGVGAFLRRKSKK